MVESSQKVVNGPRVCATSMGSQKKLTPTKTKNELLVEANKRALGSYGTANPVRREDISVVTPPVAEMTQGADVFEKINGLKQRILNAPSYQQISLELFKNIQLLNPVLAPVLYQKLQTEGYIDNDGNLLMKFEHMLLAGQLAKDINRCLIETGIYLPPSDFEYLLLGVIFILEKGQDYNDSFFQLLNKVEEMNSKQLEFENSSKFAEISRDVSRPDVADYLFKADLLNKIILFLTNVIGPAIVDDDINQKIIKLLTLAPSDIDELHKNKQMLITNVNQEILGCLNAVQKNEKIDYSVSLSRDYTQEQKPFTVSQIVNGKTTGTPLIFGDIHRVVFFGLDFCNEPEKLRFDCRLNNLALYLFSSLGAARNVFSYEADNYDHPQSQTILSYEDAVAILNGFKNNATVEESTTRERFLMDSSAMINFIQKSVPKLDTKVIDQLNTFVQSLEPGSKLSLVPFSHYNKGERMHAYMMAVDTGKTKLLINLISRTGGSCFDVYGKNINRLTWTELALDLKDFEHLSGTLFIKFPDQKKEYTIIQTNKNTKERIQDIKLMFGSWPVLAGTAASIAFVLGGGEILTAIGTGYVALLTVAESGVYVWSLVDGNKHNELKAKDWIIVLGSLFLNAVSLGKMSGIKSLKLPLKLFSPSVKPLTYGKTFYIMSLIQKPEQVSILFPFLFAQAGLTVVSGMHKFSFIPRAWQESSLLQKFAGNLMEKNYTGFSRKQLEYNLQLLNIGNQYLLLPKIQGNLPEVTTESPENINLNFNQLPTDRPSRDTN